MAAFTTNNCPQNTSEKHSVYKLPMLNSIHSGLDVPLLYNKLTQFKYCFKINSKIPIKFKDPFKINFKDFWY